MRTKWKDLGMVSNKWMKSLAKSITWISFKDSQEPNQFLSRSSTATRFLWHSAWCVKKQMEFDTFCWRPTQKCGLSLTGTMEWNRCMFLTQRCTWLNWVWTFLQIQNRSKLLPFMMESWCKMKTMCCQHTSYLIVSWSRTAMLCIKTLGTGLKMLKSMSSKITLFIVCTQTSLKTRKRVWKNSKTWKISFHSSMFIWKTCLKFGKLLISSNWQTMILGFFCTRTMVWFLQSTNAHITLEPATKLWNGNLLTWTPLISLLREERKLEMIFFGDSTLEAKFYLISMFLTTKSSRWNTSPKLKKEKRLYLSVTFWKIILEPQHLPRQRRHKRHSLNF